MIEKISENLTKKNVVIGIIVLLFLVPMFAENNDENLTKKIVTEPTETKQQEKIIVVCDGIQITEDCELDGVQYLTYKHYPAVEEVSHLEEIKTYVKEITGYCTSCNDGTRSPSCSTGRGTCSHHGGVAQWNAPIYTNVAHYEEVKVVDSPAIPERYETVVK